jgi:hypothetical protein
MRAKRPETGCRVVLNETWPSGENSKAVPDAVLQEQLPGAPVAARATAEMKTDNARGVWFEDALVIKRVEQHASPLEMPLADWRRMMADRMLTCCSHSPGVPETN